MHEASIVEGLLHMAIRSVDDYNGSNPDKKAAGIKSIVCEMGPLSCVDPQTLCACFEIFSESTIAEGAKLEIVSLPLKCKCGKCGGDFQLEKRHFICPFCGSGDIKFEGGHGLILKSINVECEEKEDG